jgi:hypothetical protein
MALRVARGLFRLWLVLSVLWIGGVVFVTLRDASPFYLTCDRPPPDRPNPCTWFDEFKVNLVEEANSIDRASVQNGILLALVPPAFVLALGSALVWAFRGFR